jgi:glycosyltransferase involved in cell wall biosynthesis
MGWTMTRWFVVDEENGVKILMVSEDLPGTRIGGLAAHVVTLSNALIEQGHEVDIMGRSDRLHAGSAAEIGFRGRLLPGFGFTHPGWKEAQLGLFNPAKRPWFARRVAGALMREADHYDVVHYHGHLPMAGRYVPPGVNFIQTRHDQGSECVTRLRFKDEHVCDTRDVRDCAACIHPTPNSLRRTVSGLAVGRYRSGAAEAFARHKTVFVSDFLRRAFLRAVPDADLSRSRVIHNFVCYPRLREHAAGAGEATAGEVLLAGRIDAGKGVGEFLAQLRGWLPRHARVAIVGDGPLRRELERLHAGPQVRFLGWQPHDDVVRMAARSHVLVMPSLLEEACPTTVLEALALGRPCVALARGGTPELAAYQYYDGQLELAETMPRLVQRLVDILNCAPVTVPLPDSFPLDVFEAIPRVLDFYNA